MSDTGIKPGFRFQNGGMRLTVLCYDEVGGENLALLLSETDGLYITVRHLSIWQGHAVYSWDWGRYYDSLHKALADYDERLSKL